MGHHHHHHHDIEDSVSGLRLLITLLMNLIITVVELIGGVLSGSLSLISDALHNFSDGIAVIISYIAIRLNRRPQSPQYTFGLKRAQIVAAIINSAVLVAISVYLFWESYFRFTSPEPIEAELMIIVASIGLLANTIGTLLLRAGAKGDMNIRSAYLHLLSDAVSSVGVIIGGAAIHFWDANWVDPLLTVLISAYILRESYFILKKALNIVLQGSPENISIEDIDKELTKIEGIKNIHHIHIWQMDEKNIHFEAHADIKDMMVSQTSVILEKIKDKLKHKFGISHVTVQFECDLCEVKDLLHE